jgi:hypothetical protein
MQGIKTEVDRDFLSFVYLDQKMSARDIDKKYGISKSVIGRAIKRFGISRNRREAEMGEMNKNWKGDSVGRGAGNARARYLLGKGFCSICGEPNANVHHKDRNPMNNNVDNLVFLCVWHHSQEHVRLRNYARIDLSQVQP